MNDRGKKVGQFLGMLVVMGVAIFLEVLLSPRGDTLSHIAIRSALQTGVLAVIPILLKLWPLEDEKPVSIGRWMAILTMYCFLIFISSWYQVTHVPHR